MFDDVLIRPIRPDDRDRHVDFFRGLSQASVSFRFLSAKKHLTEKELSYFTTVDFERHVALIATVGEAEDERTVGVGRFVIETDGDELTNRADVAITVADELQGQGVGRRLLQELIPLAKSRGVRLFDLSISTENTRALAMVNHNLHVISQKVTAGAFEILCLLDDGDDDESTVQGQTSKLSRDTG